MCGSICRSTKRARRVGLHGRVHGSGRQDGRPSIVGRRGIGLGITKATTNAANFTAAHYAGLLTN